MKRKKGAVARPARRLRVALAQMEPTLGDVSTNVLRHLRLAREAIRRRADLVVFPELSLTGYRLQDLVTEVALPVDASGALRPLLETSRRIAMVIGLVEESEGHRYYNSAVYLDGGRISHVHRKAYLPTYGMFEEGRYFAPGDSLRAFRSRQGRFGMLICEDLWHSSSSLALAQDGADYLAVIANSPTQGIDSSDALASRSTWRDILRVTARLQTIFVLWANRVGFEDGINFGGGSCVMDPFGRLIAQAHVLEEELLVCDLDRAILRRARTAYPLLRDERLELLSREVRRLIDEPAATRRSALRGTRTGS
jgi:predicted amidohydrolase